MRHLSLPGFKSIPEEVKRKIITIQKYRNLLHKESFLKEFQRWYSADLQSHLNFLGLIEMKLYKDFELDRNDKVFLYTIQRIYKES
jgi:hypothetical protein